MIAIVLVASLVGVIWGTIALLRGSLLFGCLAFVLVGACLGRDFLLLPGAITLDRIVFAALLAAYALQSCFGRTDPKPLGGAEWLLAALLAYLAGNMLAHDWRLDYPGAVPPPWRLLAGYLMPAAVYWCARQAPLSEQNVRPVGWVLAAFGVYLAATGILEISQQWSLVFPKHIADPKVGIHFGRARGPMVSAVTYGVYLATGMLACWLLWARANALGRLVIVALAPLYLAGLYLSLTRSIWMGAGLGAITLLGLSLRGAPRRWMFACALVGAVGLWVAKSDQIVNLQRETSGADSRDSSEMRGTFAYVSWRMFLDQPVFGFGFGHFQQAKLPYLDDHSVDLQLQHIRALVHHNTLLSLLTETGAIGLALFLALMAAIARNAAIVLRSPIAPEFAKRHAVLTFSVLGLYFCQLVFHELSYSALDNSLVFFLAGITSGLRAMASPMAEPVAARLQRQLRLAAELPPNPWGEPGLAQHGDFS